MGENARKLAYMGFLLYLCAVFERAILPLSTRWMPDESTAYLRGKKNPVREVDIMRDKWGGGVGKIKLNE